MNKDKALEIYDAIQGGAYEGLSDAAILEKINSTYLPTPTSANQLVSRLGEQVAGRLLHAVQSGAETNAVLAVAWGNLNSGQTVNADDAQTQAMLVEMVAAGSIEAGDLEAVRAMARRHGTVDQAALDKARAQGADRDAFEAALAGARATYEQATAQRFGGGRD